MYFTKIKKKLNNPHWNLKKKKMTISSQLALRLSHSIFLSQKKREYKSVFYKPNFSLFCP